MDLGLSTYSFPWSIGINGFQPDYPLSFIDLLEYASVHNIQYVQFGDNYPLHQLEEQDLRLMKAEAVKRRINLQVGTRGLIYSHLLDYIQIASQLESPFVRVVIDDINYQPTLKEVGHIILNVLPILKEYGIVLALENHDRFSARELEQIIMKTSCDNVAICLDTSNSLGAGEGIYEILPILLPYTINLHIKDFTIERVAHKMGFNVYGVPAGSGMLNIPWIVAECNRYEKCKTATLEMWMNPLDSIEATIQQERHWVHQSIQYLRKIL